MGEEAIWSMSRALIWMRIFLKSSASVEKKSGEQGVRRDQASNQKVWRAFPLKHSQLVCWNSALTFQEFSELVGIVWKA